MKKVKQVLSVLLAVMMLVAVVPVMEVSATQSKSDNFSSAEYHSDPGQYMVNIATAQLGRTGSSLGYTEEWCADFVSDCAKIAGQSDAIPANGLVSTLANNIWNAGGTTVSAQNAKPGDICIIDWADTSGYYNHVEIVYQVSGSSVYTIGGNTGVSNANLYTRKVARHSPISSSNIYRIIRPNYKNTTPTYTQPPTKPVVSVDKKIALINSDVTISFSSERASNYWLGIYSDGDLWTQAVVYGNSYTISYAYVGKYDIVVVARNNCGEATGYASFKLGHEGDYVPSNFTVSADKTVALRNETIKLTFSADNADRYWIGVYTSGNYCYVSDNVYGSTYSVALPWTGNYHATIVAINDCSSTTKYLNLTVVEKKEFSVTYNANGGAGAPSAQTKTYGSDLVLSNQKPSKSGYTFIKWNTKADGTGTSYNSGAAYKENADLNLYAIWQQNHTHSYTSSITKAATCIAPGVETFTCSCGDSYTKPIAINPNNHVNTTNVAAVASTCTVKGYSAGVYCNDCKQYISGHVEQPLANHQTTVINAREATYDADGYTGDTYCTVCKQTLSYGSSIPKLTKPNEPTNPTNPTQPATQPATQQQQQQSGNCKYCGGTHSGFPGILIGFFHSILAMFGLRK